MNIPLILTLSILALAVGLFLSGRVRADVVALLVAALLGVTGVLTAEEALSGFGSPAAITILAIFILVEGLRVTGVTDRVASLLLRFSGTNGNRLVVVVMVAGASLSLFMNNTAAAALLLPAASKAGDKAGVSLARLMMPLAFGTILGGMATLLTTTNIVVADLLRHHGHQGFGLLDFVPVGLPLVGVGILYMVFLGRRWLPQTAPGDRELLSDPGDDLLHVYQLGERLFRVRVPPGSPLQDHSLAASGLRERCGASVLAIERGNRHTPSPSPTSVVQAGDVLVLEGKLEELRAAEKEGLLQILGEAGPTDRSLESDTIVVVEAVLSPRSALIGQTLQGAHFREKYGMTALAVWRAGKPIRTGIRQLTLAFGDALLLQGSRERLAILRSEPDLILLYAGQEEPTPVPRKGRLAIAIFSLTLVGVALGWPPVGVAMLGGAVVMMLAGVLSVDQAYQAVEWRTVFLVAGMLPVSIAMSKSGAAELLATGLTHYLAPYGPQVFLAGAMALAVVLTQVMSGTAVAFVLAPVVILSAQRLGADPRALAMGVALATSMAFPTPLGHPVNLLVMGPAGYRFKDFARVGLPMTVLLYATVLGLLPLLWPLEAAP